MSRTRRKSKDAKDRLGPYLTSEEVMTVTGLGRRPLTSSIKFGVCAPYQDPTGTLGWTAGHLDRLMGMESLRLSGVSDKKITELASCGDGSFKTAVRESAASMLRDSRRKVKQLVLTDAAADASAAIGKQSGFYLRYIPQRWIALIPQPKTKATKSDVQQHVFSILADIAVHLGWAPSVMGGMIVGAPENARSTRYIYLELCSQPVPAPQRKARDGGCYAALGGSCQWRTDEQECKLCSDYGQPITPKDETRWSTQASNLPCQDLTVMADGLKRPYPCGPWSGYTRERYEAQRLGREGPGGGAFSRLGIAHDDVPEAIAARPRLMPHEVKLPMGATACVLPAGFYLCRQCEQADTEAAVTELVGMTRLMSNRDLTVNDEVERICALTSAMGDDVDWERFGCNDDVADMADALQFIGDPAQIGWWSVVSKEKMQDLAVLTDTGLLPGSDFSIVCSNVLGTNPDELPIRELQLLVDFGNRAIRRKGGGHTAGRKKKQKRGLAGIAAAALLEHMPAKWKPAIRCRYCGAAIKVDPSASVATCKHCGRAQALPHLEDEAAARNLKQIDDLRFKGKYKLAAERLDIECRDNPRDADLHWQRMVCRYGVSYRQEPGSGRLVPKASIPVEVPVADDPDAQLALELADDAQWDIYSKQLVMIESARQELVGQEETARAIEVRTAQDDTDEG